MISIEIAQAAIEVAEEFDKRGLRLKARSDGPIEQLGSTSTLQFAIPKNIVQSADELNAPYTPSPEVIAAESSYPSVIDPNKSVHDLELDSLIVTISDAVSQHFSFAKNTVRPLVKTLAGEIQRRMAAYPSVASFNPTLTKWDLPLPLLGESFKEAIFEYKDTAFGELHRRTVALPSIDTATALELVKTGSGSVDEEITIWLATKPADYLSDIFNIVFAANDVGQSTASFETLVNTPRSGVDAALAIYLFASKLLDNPPEGVAMGLAEYRIQMGDIVQQAALRLSYAYAKRELDISTKLIILKPGTDEVVVFTPVYDEWVAAGGNNAIIFGTICTDRPALFAPALDESAAESLKVWEQQNRFLTVVQANKRFVNMKAAILHEAEELIATHMPECFGGLVMNGAIDFKTPEVVQAVLKIEEYVGELDENSLKDVWTISTELVAKNIFYYTDAYKILMGIDAAFQENPDIDVSEAALISLVEYVTDYVADQLLVVDL